MPSAELIIRLERRTAECDGSRRSDSHSFNFHHSTQSSRVLAVESELKTILHIVAATPESFTTLMPHITRLRQLCESWAESNGSWEQGIFIICAMTLCRRHQ